MDEQLCVACGSSVAGGALRFKVSKERAAAHFVREATDPTAFSALTEHLKAMWSADSVSVVECPTCGTSNANPHVAGDETFYSLAYGQAGRDRYPHDRWEYHATLDLLAARPHLGHVLEIGAGDGVFARGLLPRATTYSATEYSESGRAALTKSGVVAFPGSTRFADIGGTFDVIMMFQVIEHLGDPLAVLSELRQVATDNAVLVVSAPNPEATRWQERHGGLLDMPPNHVTGWSSDGFRRVGQRAGWASTSYQVEPTSKVSAMRGLAISRTFERRVLGRWPLLQIDRLRNARTRTVAMAGAAALAVPGTAVSVLRDPPAGTAHLMAFTAA